MKVVLFSMGIPDAIGDLANSIGNNVELLLICPENMPGTFFKDYLSPKVKFYPYYKHRTSNPRNILSMLEVIKVIRKFNPDVVHIYNQDIWTILLYPFLQSYPIVQTIHDPTEHPGEEKIRDKVGVFFSLLTAERVAVLSEQMKKRIVKYHKVPNGKIDLIPICTPLRYCKLQKRKIPEVTNSILFFGRIWKYKGLEYLIKSEPIISEEIPNISITIAGRGEDLESYISMMKNKDKFEIINRWIEDEELNEFFQKSSIVVMPYIEASQSNIPLLAYYFKKPIIATNVGGLPELIINGKSGILVPPRDEYSLAKAITLVLKNNSLRERLVKNGSHLLNNTFTWEKTADQAINCYNKCVIE